MWHEKIKKLKKKKNHFLTPSLHRISFYICIYFLKDTFAI